jgi:hypothetical protein
VGDLINALISWPAFLVVLLVFGFAPGALLRLIVLAFPKDDPRRQELRAELYAVPRIERPIWVVEQLEVALFEGLGERIVWALTGRVISRWHLHSGVESHRAHPDTFWIPSEGEKAAIIPGTLVKLMFQMRDGWGERMWVHVDKVGRRRLVGHLHNSPIGMPRLDYGDKIKFRRDDVIDIQLSGEDETQVIDSVAVQPRRAVEMLCGGCNGQHHHHGDEADVGAPDASPA